MIRVFYTDIASVLKINGGLSAPFNIQRGVRQGCSLWYVVLSGHRASAPEAKGGFKRCAFCKEQKSQLAVSKLPALL